jgi:hypothetical protein
MEVEWNGGRRAVDRRRDRVDQLVRCRVAAIEDDDVAVLVLRGAAEEREDALNGAAARRDAADVGAGQTADQRVEVQQRGVGAAVEVVLIDRAVGRADPVVAAVDDRVVNVTELRLDVELQQARTRRAFTV